MTRPRTSLLLSRFRPDRPTGGAALRNRQNLHALAQLGPVDVVTISEQPEVSEPMTASSLVRDWTAFSLAAEDARRPAWEHLRARSWLARPGIHPSVDHYRRQTIVRSLQRLLADRSYDVVVVEELSLAGYLPLLRRAGVRLVFDAHNVESRLREELTAASHGAALSFLRRRLQRLRARRLFEEEQRAVQNADLVWACSALDARALQHLYRPRAAVAVVPNGIDISAYQPSGHVPADSDWGAHPFTLSFLGTYSYRPNEDAALQLMTDLLPRLQQRQLQPHLLLIGRDPTPAMRAAAGGRTDITITGAVPSILPHLQRPSIVTLPIALGSGTRLKILEAFATDRPVVSSHKGAEGLEALDGQHLLLRDDPAAMADAVTELWVDRARRSALCAAAHRLVAQRYSWSAAAQAVAASLAGAPAR